MINLLLGDARFFWQENLKTFAHIPFAWDSSLNTGIGTADLNTLWITSYLNFASSFSYLGFSWSLINLIFYLLPILIISFVSSFFIFRTIINKNNLFAFFAGIIFTTNTYFLSIFLGGQSGVAFAYALIPLVFLSFYKLLGNLKLSRSVIFGFVFSAQILFDPRIALLTLLILVFYYLSRFKFRLKELLLIALIPATISLLLHVFWILPLIFYKTNIIPKGFTSILGVKFFSFAFFENSLSLLHPNWPENIFGKTYFMRPEFLLIPVLAFSSLFFIAKNKVKNQSNDILFFSLVALIGAFLAKGTNEPFGNLFSFLFENIPGFSIFRDPTKFYMLIALSYSILVPFTLFKISEHFKRQKLIIVILFLIFWIASLRGLFLSDTNLLKARQVPQDYIRLKNFIVNQNHFFRTLWIPAWQRYGYFSDINPAIGRGEIFKEASASGMVKELSSQEEQQRLEALSVKYVIVPEDSDGEIFLDDRKYSENEYLKVVSDVRRISNLKELPSFGKIKIFEIQNTRDRFWSTNKSLNINYKFINPTKYEVNIYNAKQGNVLVFSEGFDKNWTIKSDKFSESSKDFNGLNSFDLPLNGDYSFEVRYEPQKLVEIGLLISSLTIFGTLILLLRFRKS